MPEDLAESLRWVASKLLGRDDLDQDMLGGMADRLAYVQRIRRLDERLLSEVPPAFAYRPDQEAYRGPTGMATSVLRSLEERGSPGPVPPPGAHREGRDPGSGAATGLSARETAGSPARPGGPELQADDEVARLSLVEQVAAVRRGEISSVELIQRSLERAERIGRRLNAFVTVDGERALEQARQADRLLASGRPLGVLHGVPVAYKDLFYTAGIPTTGGSPILRDFKPERDATAVRRMREAGAISIGKTNTHQFAYGATTESSLIGPSRNPWNLRRSPGGSSGGSGAAVAARIVACALGTDTAGSIRIPAAACGVFGIKPTYGRVSKAGVLPLSWSLDHVGPLTVSVADAALVLEVLAGQDPEDATTQAVPVGAYVRAAERGRQVGAAGLRVGVLSGWIEDRVDEGIQVSVRGAVAALRDAGARIVEREFLRPEALTVINRVITLAEAGSYHAPLLAEHAQAYAPDIRSRLELGQLLLARDYLLAQRLRAEVARRVNEELDEVDVLLAPTLPISAPEIGTRMVEWADGPETISDVMVRLNAPFNVSGHPAATVPFGKASDGLPAGVQIIGRAFDEATVFQVAAALERARTP